ncbi:MAG: hypothetical protein PHV09_08275 [Bacteroidales bacterium]|nr:hypothetical protein [Bacteroidales bacterium]
MELLKARWLPQTASKCGHPKEDETTITLISRSFVQNFAHKKELVSLHSLRPTPQGFGEVGEWLKPAVC